MSEELNEVVEVADVQEQEEAQEIVEQVQESVESESENVDLPKVEAQVKTEKVIEREENIKALRESRKQMQQERDEFAKRIQALEAAQIKKPDAFDEDFDEDVNQKEIKVLKQNVAQMADSNSRMKLSTEYPDFGKVVTQESIAILKQRFPEIAATLDQSRDIYTTGVSAYNIIKKFGLHVDDEYEAKKENVENNINKPRPVSSLKSSSALSYANDYSDLSDKKVREEVIRIATERANNA